MRIYDMIDWRYIHFLIFFYSSFVLTMICNFSSKTNNNMKRMNYKNSAPNCTLNDEIYMKEGERGREKEKKVRTHTHTYKMPPNWCQIILSTLTKFACESCFNAFRWENEAKVFSIQTVLVQLQRLPQMIPDHCQPS